MKRSLSILFVALMIGMTASGNAAQTPLDALRYPAAELHRAALG
jgi:hypothetical protein